MHDHPDLAELGARISAEDDPTAGRRGTETTRTDESAAAIADPAPLGLAGFALTTFVLSLVNANWMPAATAPVVPPGQQKQSSVQGNGNGNGNAGSKIKGLIDELAP